MKQEVHLIRWARKISAKRKALRLFIGIGPLLGAACLLAATLIMTSGQAHSAFPGHNFRGDFGLLNARFFWETGARSTLEGTTLTVTATFPIPNVALQ